MSVTSSLSYFPSPADGLRILKDFAAEQFPAVDFATASEAERGPVIAKALELGLAAVAQEVRLHSLRANPLSIDQGGAQLCLAPSQVDFQSPDFRYPVDLQQEYRTKSHISYYEEMEVLARRLLGPKVVHAWCLFHILRRSGGSGAVGESAGPLRSVHNDFTEEYGDVVRKLYTTHPSMRGQQLRKMLKQLKGLQFTEQEMAKYRVVVINLWRPITVGPLRRDPLAVCDNRTVSRSDLQRRRTDIGNNKDDPYDDLELSVYLSQYNSGHRWHYIPDFTNREVLAFKTYDSEVNPFIPTLHSAFDLPNQEGAPARESCECRVICLLPKDAALVSRL